MKPVKDLAKSHAVQTGVAAAAAAAAGAVAGARRARRASSAELEVPPEVTPSVQGYCVKERKKVMIADPVQTTMKNGKPAIRGVCPDCGTKIFRIGTLAPA